MSRSLSSNGRVRRRKRILKLAKGFRGRCGTNYKAAKDAVSKALAHSYVARRDRKGSMRRLWIRRINASVRTQGLSYSRFMNGLLQAGIALNRKVLSNMAIEDPGAFQTVIDASKKALGGGAC